MGGPQPMIADRMNGDRSPATEHRGQPDVDPSVIASAARGDAVAFGQIYTQTAPRVRRYVRTIIRNPWDAEDVTQDAFVKILTGIGQYDPARGAFSAWSLRIARNAAIDHIRAHRGGLACAEVDQRAPVDDAGRWCSESLRLVLSDLNQNQREILVLRALAGFEPSEIAGYAKATRGSINTLYHRARLAARDRLRAIDAGPCTRTVTKRSPDGARLSRAA
jgi:RNA polymerase sigma-70 factor (ECF subfamily)